MCGIFGSTNINTYKTLYNINKKRGTFSYGSLYTKNQQEYELRRIKGTVDLVKEDLIATQFNMFLGHTQAPTSSQREFTERTSHPFDDLYHIVAHNGVLENAQQIEDEYLIGHLNPVDSSVIPALIGILYDTDIRVHNIESDTSNPKTGEVIAIEQACSKLKGTFACWLFSKATGCIYIFRSGSTIFANFKTGDFSSVYMTDVCEQPLDEGVIYCVTTEGIAKCGTFESTSPFFI